MQKVTTFVDTEFDEFTKLENIFVELVVVDDGKDRLVQPLELLHVVNSHVTKLYYASATINKVVTQTDINIQLYITTARHVTYTFSQFSTSATESTITTWHRIAGVDGSIRS